MSNLFHPQELIGIRHQARISEALALPDQPLAEPLRSALIAHSAEARRALEKKLDGFTRRALVREQVLARLRVLRHYVGFDRQLDALLDRMQHARQEFTISRRLSDGKLLRQWDQKSGDARLDPDDAREEAARWSRRVSPAVESMIAAGDRVTYAVFTMPNFAPGELRRGCRTIYRRFSGFLRRCKRGKVPGCSAIRGAAVVLEAPLGARRDWNVHLNVLLVHKGFIDYRALRAAWHWNVELQPVVPTQAGVANALREIIKYNVLSVAEKSADKAAARRSPAPPMVEWTDPELWEWICAFRRFRRTRTYGVLYRLPKPEKLDHAGFQVVGFGTWSSRGRRFVVRFPLLDSIPEDKSNREQARSYEQPRGALARAGPTTGQSSKSAPAVYS